MCTATMCTDWYSECLNVHGDNVYRLVLSVSICTMTMCIDWFSECLNVHHDNVYRRLNVHHDNVYRLVLGVSPSE